MEKHPNADRLFIANALGYFVIVGKDTPEGQLGVVFPSDGRLSEEMLLNNNLYRKHPVTGQPMGGYFEENGRVKALRLRGAKSEAFWCPLSYLDWTGADLSKLKEGDQFSVLNDKTVCEKYFTPATIRAMSGGGNGSSAKKTYAPDFKEHLDTGQLRDLVTFIQGKEPVYNVTYTLKIHGTSGRTGNVLWLKPNGFWQKLLDRVHLFKGKYRIVSGTRRVVLDPDSQKEDGFYTGTNFRDQVHKMIAGMNLRKNEILYYEIAGYTDTGALIMSEHNLNKQSMKEAGIPPEEYERYGSTMRYTYGCEPNTFRVFVYRIMQDGKDLSYSDMVERVNELAKLNTTNIQFGSVPVLLLGTTNDDLMKESERLTRGDDIYGNHIREGVTLRLEDSEGNFVRILKYKGFLFSVLEGIRKNTDDYIDLEETM